MPLKVITKPAKIEDSMSLYLQMSIETSNDHIEKLAEELRKSAVNRLDPNDGRDIIVTYTVDSKTGSINQTKEFKQH
mgnify:CR=1 FL=1